MGAVCPALHIFMLPYPLRFHLPLHLHLHLPLHLHLHPNRNGARQLWCCRDNQTRPYTRPSSSPYLTYIASPQTATESTPHSSFCVSFPFHSISSATPNNGQHQIKPNQRPGWLADWAGPLVFVSLQHVVWILYMRRVGHRIN